MTGIYFTGAMQLNYAFPTGSIEPIEYPLIQAAHNEEPVAANRLTAPTAADLIKEIRESSGLTLEMIAPLLGVSRRSIQSWKAGEPISVRKEERLRELAGAIKKMSQGKPKETQNLLLERIPGTPRIYDLLAERRFETAITRAKAREKFKPIYSDQSLIFSHVLLDAQIAAADDGPSEQTGQIDRKVSRRLKR
ncbi:MAG: helix-turn-helix domain-containing protein [Blastocatellia bacterium]